MQGVGSDSVAEARGVTQRANRGGLGIDPLGLRRDLAHAPLTAGCGGRDRAFEPDHGVLDLVMPSHSWRLGPFAFRRALTLAGGRSFRGARSANRSCRRRAAALAVADPRRITAAGRARSNATNFDPRYVLKHSSSARPTSRRTAAHTLAPRPA